MKDELKPFWRTFCNEQGDEVEDLITSLKNSAYDQFGLGAEEDTSQVDSFTGGIKAQSAKQTLKDRIQKFCDDIRSATKNEDSLDLRMLCMSNLSDSS